VNGTAVSAGRGLCGIVVNLVSGGEKIIHRDKPWSNNEYRREPGKHCCQHRHKKKWTDSRERCPGQTLLERDSIQLRYNLSTLIARERENSKTTRLTTFLKKDSIHQHCLGPVLQ